MSCLRPRVPGLPTTWGKESSATTDSSSVVQAGLALAAFAHQNPGLGWQWMSSLGQELLPPGVLPHGGNLWAQTGH